MSHTRQLGLAALLAAALAAASGAQAVYNYNASDFTTEVPKDSNGRDQYNPSDSPAVDSITGLAMTTANNALGRPTIDTSGDFGMPAKVPTLPVFPSWRGSELVSIGRPVDPVHADQPGLLVLKFDHKVFDNPLNPYGRDLIIFGNSLIAFGNNSYWKNGNPNSMYCGSSFAGEQGLVKVSQDGVTWKDFPTPDPEANPPVLGADDFAPTLGRVYDSVHPDTSLGSWNLWWGHPTNPTLPLNPSLTASSFAGKSVAQAAQMYGESAGGTSFDIGTLSLATDPTTGWKWIQYVRIEVPYVDLEEYPETPASVEIDAIADVFARRPGDANLDGVVDVGDLGILSTNYGLTGKVWESGNFDGDLSGAVDVSDLAILSTNYGLTNGEYPRGGAGGGAPVPSPVPEPATMILLVLGSMLSIRKRS